MNSDFQAIPTTPYNGKTIIWNKYAVKFFGNKITPLSSGFDFLGFKLCFCQVLPKTNWLNNQALNVISNYFDIRFVPMTDNITDFTPDLIINAPKWEQGDTPDKFGYYDGDRLISVTYGRDCVGTLELACQLLNMGIYRPETIDEEHRHCSIGYSLVNKKYYGWSHRAIAGFAIGEVIKQNDLVTTSGWTDEYLAENPDLDRTLPVGFELNTMEDCKKAAIAFASAVS